MKASPEHLREWDDLTSGLMLLVGPMFDWHPRAIAAMDSGDVDAMEHLTALALSQLAISNEAPAFAQEKWGRLSREYHAKFCAECAKDDAPGKDS